MSDGQTIPKQYILLDTCILQYTGTLQSQVEFLKYLLELMSRGFGLAFSNISIYELLRGATVKKEAELIKILDIFNRYFIDESVLIAGAQLNTLYKEENIQTEDGDQIIAATSILTGSLILTANGRDFPWPFFDEVENKIIQFNIDRQRKKTIPICILKPNIEIINERFWKRK